MWNRVENNPSVGFSCGAVRKNGAGTPQSRRLTLAPLRHFVPAHPEN
jgi:hypothetical protein